MEKRPAGIPRWQWEKEQKERHENQMHQIMHPFQYPSWFRMEQYNSLKEQAELSQDQLRTIVSMIVPKRDWKLFEAGVLVGLVVAVLFVLLMK